MDNNNQPTMKDEVIRLLLADMRNRKLLMGLESAGLSTDEFNTDLSELIFTKMGIMKKDEVRIGNWYEDIVFNILDVDLHTFKEHQLFFAVTLYDSLKEESRKLQTEQLLKSKPTFSFLHSSELRRFDN